MDTVKGRTICVADWWRVSVVSVFAFCELTFNSCVLLGGESDRGDGRRMRQLLYSWSFPSLGRLHWRKSWEKGLFESLENQDASYYIDSLTYLTY